MRNKVSISILLMLGSIFLYAQEKKKLKDIVSVNGYVKYLPSVSFTDGDNIITDNLIHNRINIRATLNKRVTAGVDFRNRIFYGETVKMNPFLGNGLDKDNGVVDMSFLLLNKNAIVIHSIIDRAWLDYAKGKWEIRLGRQRINWGINLAWNSNDLFNAYNLVDFDYAERPGTDAIRVQYYTGDLSSIDLAYQPGEDMDKTVLAGLHKFNKWKYDFQWLAGNYFTDVALGAGWAGNIKNSGFKGEATYFHPKENFGDTTGVASLSTSWDYSFKGGIYVNASFLYNSGGTNTINLASQQQFLGGNLSAKNLMPTKYSYFAQVSGAFNPIINGGLAVVYGQGMDILFVMPSLGYSIKENWSLDLTGQVFFASYNNSLTNFGNNIFLRLWYSY